MHSGFVDQIQGAANGLKPMSRLDFAISLMGPTGTGKSTFVQLLTNQKVEVGTNLRSETDNVCEFHLSEPIIGRSVTVIDTPGFGDSRKDKPDTEILREISTCFSRYYDPVGKSSKVIGIIYFHRITDPRMGGNSIKNVRMLEKICGEESLKNIVIVTTRWDELADESVGVGRETEMKTSLSFFQPLVEKGARFLRHNNTRESALNIIKKLVMKDPIPLQIQKELEEGMKISDTAAGSELIRDLKDLIMKQEIEKERIQREIMKATAMRDEEWKKEIEEERADLERKLEEAREATKVSEGYTSRPVFVRVETEPEQVHSTSRREERFNPAFVGSSTAGVISIS